MCSIEILMCYEKAKIMSKISDFCRMKKGPVPDSQASSVERSGFLGPSLHELRDRDFAIPATRGLRKYATRTSAIPRSGGLRDSRDPDLRVFRDPGLPSLVPDPAFSRYRSDNFK